MVKYIDTSHEIKQTFTSRSGIDFGVIYDDPYPIVKISSTLNLKRTLYFKTPLHD